MPGAQLEAGHAFVDLVPRLDKTAAAGAEAQMGAAFGGLSSKAKATGLAIGAGLAVGAVAAGAAAFAIGASFDDAYDTIRVKTGQTGAVLEGLKGSFKSVVSAIPTNFGDAGAAIAGLNQSLGLTGKPLEELSKQVLELSRVTETDLAGNVKGVSELFVNFGIGADDQADKLDRLFRASQATGVSVGDLAGAMASGGSVLRQAGLSFEQSAALVGLLGKAGVEAGSVMAPLSRAVASAAKEGKNAGDVFRGAFDAIRTAPSATAAAGAAIEVFGAKAGPKLAGLIREGKLSYEDLAKTISAGGDTIVGAAKETNDFGESFNILKNKVLVAVEPLATGFFNAVSSLVPKLEPLVAWIGEKLPLAIEWAKDKFEEWKPGLETVRDIFVTVGEKVLWLGERVIEAVGWIIDNWNLVKPVMEAVAALILLVMIPQWIALGVKATVSAATQVAAWVSTKAAAIASTVVSSVQMGIQVAKWIWLAATAMANAAIIAAAWLLSLGPIAIVVAAVIAAVALIIVHWDTIKDAAAAVFNWVKDNWPLLLAIITGPIGLAVLAVVKNWDKIKDAVSGVKDWIVEKWDAIVAFITGVPGKITEAAKGMWDGIKGAFKSAINAILKVWNALEFKIPGFKIGPVGFDGFTLGVPDIPLLARGGTVARAGLGIVGDQGPELSGLSRGATIVPLDVAAMIAGVARTGDGTGQSLHFEVHNPVPEPATVSIPRMIRRAAVALGTR